MVDFEGAELGTRLGLEARANDTTVRYATVVLYRVTRPYGGPSAAQKAAFWAAYFNN
jgi:hypothetical protein